MDLGSVSWRGISPRSDSPDRLVGYDNLGEGGRIQARERCGELAFHHLEGFLPLAFFEFFPDTEDRAQLVPEECPNLASGLLVGFPEDMASLGMTHEGSMRTCLAGHRHAHLSSEGPLVLPMDVLCPNDDARPVSGRLGDGGECHSGREEPDFPTGFV